MASQVVRYQVDESAVVGFDVESGSGWHQAGAKEVAGRIREAVEPAIEAAKVVLEKVKDAKPDEVEVKFGIEVTGEANWIVARAATEGSSEVTLTWNPSGEPAALIRLPQQRAPTARRPPDNSHVIDNNLIPPS